ncbi:hypothetical protein P7K49_026146 [Saguinus oedipus]|uniref:Uncharacterized protein n=1 Tax=Saguinus oedipus TaxID=9490 RepID=A0ABQ9UJ56_SAGOE|nr:hypothetical protein P7K49_026146 [Saguinus oedipus]
MLGTALEPQEPLGRAVEDGVACPLQPPLLPLPTKTHSPSDLWPPKSKCTEGEEAGRALHGWVVHKGTSPKSKSPPEGPTALR